MRKQEVVVKRSREEKLAVLRQRHHLPVLIVGGGINGISTFRELALQGVPVVLIEKDDWCQAASGALSRMIHGGLRYLETGEFDLVKESVQERDRLLKNAPHYVAPLRTTVPVDSWGGGLVNASKRFLRLSEKPARRGALLLKTGLSLYDLYTRQHGSMPRHRLHNRAETRARWPSFADWVKYSATYYDAWIKAPERLGVELVLDAENSSANALALNYLSLEESDGERVTLRDRLTGEKFTFEPHIVVNAAGAWIDRINHQLLPTEPPKLIGGTKGSHLIVDSPALLAELRDEMVYYENQDGRVCIMFPWYGKVLVGSTDIRVDNPDDIACSPEEQRYILESLRFVFPHIEVRDDDVLYTFAGVRPLPASDTQLSGRITRNHSLVYLPPDATRDFSVLNLVGGKWTTFRRFGEQAADRVLKLLGEQRQRSTEEMAIGGGRNFPCRERRASWIQELHGKYRVPESRIDRLIDRYGTRAVALLRLIAEQDEQPLQHHAGYSDTELRWLIRQEQVVMLEDLLLRRTALGISGELTPPLMAEIAHLMAQEMGWSVAARQQQLELTLARLARLHGVSGLRLASPSPYPSAGELHVGQR
ncbi:FAD-dependent oxidoreductase [Mixta tenebrionis]|uniref:glycerol-3-phosphate dehydrogenase/oxidase n=1 Tax=Mixta tenebrionis TaxID=2562439 RepID=UPI001366D4B8|nr:MULTISPECIES: glycerol-3-phosphate dehydrogenase/oxidase [Mixta]QHM76838.1 Aerobic glycerol-3-phosphate dehydrogenase [Mixta theicola]